jgi:membrane associated rhomboid family serine protease
MNDPQQTDNEEEWVEVGHYPSLAQAYDHGLVILAMGEACRVEPSEIPGEFHLQAEPVPAGKIALELDTYGKESEVTEKATSATVEWARYPAGWKFCAVWVLALLGMFYWQGADPTLVDRAASSADGLLDHGEWWRPFTALFLHADVPHLVGNVVGGTIFATLVSKMIGPWRAWPLILACGAMGNFLTAWLHHPDPFSSIGASTGVFAALGILSGLGAAESLKERKRLPWARITAPVMAGLVLLGWLGTGDAPHTDVMGHVLGFGSGLVAGVATGALMQPDRPAEI